MVLIYNCLCRGCPKAYHPSCVNRDEAFFRAKGRWNCGKLSFIFIFYISLAVTNHFGSVYLMELI